VQVKGNRDFRISAERLWAYLMDPVVLAKITPGISALELIEEDQYKTIGNAHGTIKMNIDGVDDALSTLSFDGNVNLSGLVARTGRKNT